jgi:hypothetical protein
MSISREDLERNERDAEAEMVRGQKDTGRPYGVLEAEIIDGKYGEPLRTIQIKMEVERKDKYNRLRDAGMCIHGYNHRDGDRCPQCEAEQVDMYLDQKREGII